MIIEIILILIASLIGLCFILTGWGISKYNFFQSSRQDIENQWSNIKTEYQRRFDLFLNLAESVKSYKNHEKQTLVELTKARSMVNFAGNNIKQQVKNMGMLEGFFSKLMVANERYPELKADKTHLKLMDEIKISEERINIARTCFNDLVNEYNTEVKVFPSSIIANMNGFKVWEYYINEQISNSAPKIKLD